VWSRLGFEEASVRLGAIGSNTITDSETGSRILVRQGRGILGFNAGGTGAGAFVRVRGIRLGASLPRKGLYPDNKWSLPEGVRFFPPVIIGGDLGANSAAIPAHVFPEPLLTR